MTDRPICRRYTDQEKEQACVHFAVTGSAKRVSEQLSIPRSTVKSWQKTEWWDDLLTSLRQEKNEEIRARYVELIEASQIRAMEVLPDASYQQLVTGAAICFDKVRLQDNAPTRITANDQSLQSLAQSFQDIATQYRASRGNVVQVIDNTQEKGPIDDGGQGQKVEDE